jgi:hypothetical protein
LEKKVNIGFTDKVQARLHFAIQSRFTEAELLLIQEWDATVTYSPFKSVVVHGDFYWFCDETVTNVVPTDGAPWYPLIRHFPRPRQLEIKL